MLSTFSASFVPRPDAEDHPTSDTKMPPAVTCILRPTSRCRRAPVYELRQMPSSPGISCALCDLSFHTRAGVKRKSVRSSVDELMQPTQYLVLFCIQYRAVEQQHSVSACSSALSFSNAVEKLAMPDIGAVSACIASLLGQHIRLMPQYVFMRQQRIVVS